MSVEALVRRTQEGDQLALEKLYRLLSDRYFHWIRQKIRNFHDAEDIFQEVFLKLWKTYLNPAKNFWQGEAQFFSLFNSIVRSVLIDVIRQKNQTVPLQAEEERIEDYDALLFHEDRLSPGIRKRIEAILTAQERKVWEGYLALVEAFPACHTLGKHERTRLLQEYTGLKGNAFYIVHSRMKAKIESVLREYCLIRAEEGK